MNKYAFKDYDSRIMARAMAVGSPISKKQGVEICNFIRNKLLVKAKDILNKVTEQKQAVPFRRFNKDRGHKKKIGPGSYPIAASKEILSLINNAEANAQFKGLNTSKLVIKHIAVNQGAKTLHYGRKTRRKAKRANIEVVVMEQK